MGGLLGSDLFRGHTILFCVSAALAVPISPTLEQDLRPSYLTTVSLTAQSKNVRVLNFVERVVEVALRILEKM